MQIFTLLLVMGLLIERDLGVTAWAELGTGWMLAAAVGAYALPMAATWAGCAWTLRVSRRKPGRAHRAINRLHVLLALCRWLTLAIFLTSILALGWVDWLHARLGDWVVVDELIAMGPPLIAAVFGWWAYYPIDRRLREAVLMRQLDEGQPIFSFHTRWQYVTEQVRHQVLLVGVPLGLILLWTEAARRMVEDGWVSEDSEMWLTAGGALGVLIFAPLIVRVIWRTEPMPSGELRERLTELCRVNGVKVKQLLLWRTHTGLVNGAVVGLMRPLRYILLTDGLVQQLDDAQVEAVMAHELGHVKRRHMPWLAVCALGTLGAIFSAADAAMYLVAEVAGRPEWHDLMYAMEPDGSGVVEGVAMGATLAAAVGLWALLFGWISRRFERQADTFAVQHLSVPGSPTITPGAIDTMAGALERVSDLNHSPRSRHNWRHGSIDWRVGYLRSLAGRAIDDCPIDATVRRICWGCAALLAISAVWQWWSGAPAF